MYSYSSGADTDTTYLLDSNERSEDTGVITGFRLVSMSAMRFLLSRPTFMGLLRLCRQYRVVSYIIDVDHWED